MVTTAVKPGSAYRPNGHTRTRGAASRPETRKKWVYLFSEGNAQMRDLLGGKGADLAEMARLGLPVPPGFIVTTRACNVYHAAGEEFPPGLWGQILDALKEIEKLTGKRLGDPRNPLLVSCRSGARLSMPGMMDTILNIGLNDETVQGLIALTGDPRFVYDSYRRLVQMFGSVVLGIPDDRFEEVLASFRVCRGVANDSDLTADDWAAIAAEFKAIVLHHAGREFPADPLEQLELATEAVFKSWNGKRAMDYRNAAGIPHDLGTAVNIVTMVFGNLGLDSATGVAMSRNASTGEPELEGDYLTDAQGEDVVAGTRQTKPLGQLKAEMPAAYETLERIARRLEKHYRNMQDMEFTVERGKLWMLQTRNGKRTAQAEVRIAVDMVEEGLITKEEAVRRVKPEQIEFFLHPQFEAAAPGTARRVARGLAVSPGAAVGVAVFDADTAERWAKDKKLAVIMVRPETKPDDVHGMLAAQGILTSRGGRTSHAALVARQFGKPAVVGASDLEIDEAARLMRIGELVIEEGQWLSVDGTTGEVFLGQLPTVVPEMSNPYLLKLLGWADEIRRLDVWANADYPRDAERARAYGAEGIGLCRTEHMFFETDRLPYVQQMILARSDEERAELLARLLPFQRADFEGLFRAMDSLPVTIRLIDPPLHEFLPGHDELLREVTELETRLKLLDDDGDPTGLTRKLAEKRKLLEAVESMREANPMLGLRGVRLGIHLPALVKMQVRAIFEAACRCAKEGVVVHPKVMIPLTAHSSELRFEGALLEEEARRVMAQQGIEIDYQFGTMIEIPRAALTADQIARYAQFFSFGTNDLTQTTYGISRDDAESGFLMEYLEKGILPENPFATIDEHGVGKLMEMGVKLGRQTRPDLEVGICGEHGGDPKSIAFCHKIGLNYVSCSPFRVPVARLAAAHAALGKTSDD